MSKEQSKDSASKPKLSVNREYKDTLFRSLFGEKEAFVELYNAISERRIFAAELKSIVLNDVFYHALRNDLAFGAGNRMFILTEHQSTHDKNLPFRMLSYVMATYLQYNNNKPMLEEEYLPRPELYMIYHGQKKLPDYIRLSDLFHPDDSARNLIYVECLIKVIDIRRGNPALKLSPLLFGYGRLIEEIDKHRRSGKTKDEAIRLGIRYCKENGLLEEYLKIYAREARQMLNNEFSYDEEILWNRRDAKKEGLKEGKEEGIVIGKEEGIAIGKEEGKKDAFMSIVRNMRVQGLSNGEIAALTNLPMEFVVES